MKESEMETIVGFIDDVINNFDDDAKLEAIAQKVNALMRHRPLVS
jgi:glycine hydroxymethyltransferase